MKVRCMRVRLKNNRGVYVSRVKPYFWGYVTKYWDELYQLRSVEVLKIVAGALLI